MYKIGDTVRSVGKLSKWIDGYYAACDNKLVIEGIVGDRYKVKPVGYEDVIETGYFDLIPDNLRNSRFFTNSELIRSGIMVESVDGFRGMVVSSDGDEVRFSDGSVRKSELIEVLSSVGDSDFISYLREDL